MTDNNKDRTTNITDSLANRTLIVTTILVSPAAEYQYYYQLHYIAILL